MYYFIKVTKTYNGPLRVRYYNFIGYYYLTFAAFASCGSTNFAVSRTGAACCIFFFFKTTLDTRTSNEVFVGGARYQQDSSHISVALRATINHYRLSIYTRTAIAYKMYIYVYVFSVNCSFKRKKKVNKNVDVNKIHMFNLSAIIYLFFPNVSL